MPWAIQAAFWPAMPPPSTSTLAAATPETPPINTPRPPHSRSSRWAPTWGAIPPATPPPRRVGHRGGAALQQGLGALAAGGQMQVGEQHLVLAEPVELLGDRLLHLEDEVGLAPDLVGGLEHGGPGLLELLVGDGAAQPGALLDHDPVAGVGQLADADRRDRDPVLVVLELPRDANVHGRRLSSPRPTVGPGQTKSTRRGPAGQAGRAAARRAGASGVGRSAGSGVHVPASLSPYRPSATRVLASPG